MILYECASQYLFIKIVYVINNVMVDNWAVDVNFGWQPIAVMR